MEYELVYDAAHHLVGWQLIAGWLVLFAFLVVMIYETDRIPQFIYMLLRIDERDTGWGRTLIAIVVLLLGAVSIGVIKENLKLRSMSKNNECTQIAGIVTNFKAEVKDSQGPQTPESFTLNDIEFKYGSSFLTYGLNTVAADDGPIYEGAEVRLCYIELMETRRKNRKILRVERGSVK